MSRLSGCSAVATGFSVGPCRGWASYSRAAATPAGVTVIVPELRKPSEPSTTSPVIGCVPPAYGSVKLVGPAARSAVPGWPGIGGGSGSPGPDGGQSTLAVDMPVAPWFSASQVTCSSPPVSMIVTDHGSDPAIGSIITH